LIKGSLYFHNLHGRPALTAEKQEKGQVAEKRFFSVHNKTFSILDV
jgi:hypothetical protein